jgi:hypothetical protein
MDLKDGYKIQRKEDEFGLGNDFDLVLLLIFVKLLQLIVLLEVRGDPMIYLNKVFRELDSEAKVKNEKMKKVLK